MDISAVLFGQDIGEFSGEVSFLLENKEPKRIVVAATVMKQSFQVIDSHGADVKEVTRKVRFMVSRHPANSTVVGIANFSSLAVCLAPHWCRYMNLTMNTIHMHYV